jgi:hypothetical protein
MDLETDIQDEIAACENTQNWTGGRAIRTRWVDELKGLDETLEALTRATQLKDEALYSETLDYDECCKAVEEATESFRAANKAAIDKQYELCEIVALRFADLDAIKDRVSYDPEGRRVMLRDPLQELHCTTFIALRTDVTAYPVCLEYHLKRGRCSNCGRFYVVSKPRPRIPRH